MNPAVLQAENITKKFPGVVALKGVSFDLREAEIHGLCGENGAGKSTLIKLISGIYPHGSYEGDFFVHGQLVKFRSLADAQNAGIAVIYQELALVNDMTVGENIFLGSEPRTSGGLIDWHKVYHEARVLLRKFNVEIDPSEHVSHKLDELFAVCDRITVLRDGASIATLETNETDKADVIKHMVGREISDLFPRRGSKPGSPALEVENLTVADPHSGEPFLTDISFSLRAGEVLGVGGLMGAGRTELLMHLFGAWGMRLSGSVRLNGWELLARKPEEIIRRGMVLVSEDRRRYGLILDKTIGFNLSLSSLAKLTKNRLIDQGLEFQKNNHFFQSLRVKAPTLEALVAKLSGGTQQKVVLGKALMTEPLVIFLDEPTRGIDVGAKLEIYEIINRLTDAGKAVLLVSSEMPELMGMSDRIVILHEGRIGGEFDRDEATPEKLLAAAMGQRQVALT